MKKLLLILLFPIVANASLRDDAQAVLDRAGLSRDCFVATPNPDAQRVKVSCYGPSHEKYTKQATAEFTAAQYVVTADGLGIRVAKD